MTMTRKDFDAVASVLARARLSLYSGTVDALAADMADALAGCNERFDRARFLAACSPEAAAFLMENPAARVAPYVRLP